MAAADTRTGAHSRSSSTVIPAVPRLFEKKKPTNSIKKHQAAQDVALSQTSKELGRGDNDIVKEVDRNAETSYDSLEAQSGDALHKPIRRGPNLTPKQAIATTSDSPLHHSRIGPARALDYQRSVSFPAPSDNERRQSSSISNGLNPDADATPTNRSHRKRSVHKIAFGSFGNQSESSESSPTIPLSATSTHCTQPTPISETRSQASKSENGQTNPYNPQDDWHRRSGDVSQNLSLGLVGPYPPGFIGNHALNFTKHQQQYLAQYIQDLFRRGDGDLTFDVIFNSGTVRYNLHSGIVTQSPMFAKAVQHGFEARQFSSEGKLYIPINVQDKFVTAVAIETLLKSLYGIASFDIKALSQPYLHPQPLFALFAASCLLAMPVYQVFISNCIIELLSWQTLPVVLDLCLTGQHFPATRDPYPRRIDDLVTPIFQPQVAILFDRAISVLVQELNNPDFSFDTRAPNLQSIGGLPHSESDAEPPSSASDSRLSIVLDDSNTTVSSRNRLLSCVLLSLPLPVLQRVIAETNTGRAAEIVELVVPERQQRRERWSKVPGREDLGLVREICIPVDILPNGLGLINDMS